MKAITLLCRACSGVLPRDILYPEDTWARYCPECGFPCDGERRSSWTVITRDLRMLCFRSEAQVRAALHVNLAAADDTLICPGGAETQVRTVALASAELLHAGDRGPVLLPPEELDDEPEASDRVPTISCVGASIEEAVQRALDASGGVQLAQEMEELFARLDALLAKGGVVRPSSSWLPPPIDALDDPATSAGDWTSAPANDSGEATDRGGEELGVPWLGLEHAVVQCATERPVTADADVGTELEPKRAQWPRWAAAAAAVLAVAGASVAGAGVTLAQKEQALPVQTTGAVAKEHVRPHPPQPATIAVEPDAPGAPVGPDEANQPLPEAAPLAKSPVGQHGSGLSGTQRLLADARAARLRGSDAQASRLYYLALARDVTNCAALTGLARLALDKRWWEAAEGYLASAVAADESCVEASVAYADLNWLKGDVERATRRYRTILERYGSEGIPEHVVARASEANRQ